MIEQIVNHLARQPATKDQLRELCGTPYVSTALRRLVQSGHVIEPKTADGTYRLSGRY